MPFLASFLRSSSTRFILRIQTKSVTAAYSRTCLHYTTWATPSSSRGTLATTHNTRRVCTEHPETKLPMHALCPTKEWEHEWYGVTTPNIFSGQRVIPFFGGATPPLIGEAEEVVAAEPMGAF